MRHAWKNASEHPAKIIMRVGMGGFPPIQGIGIACNGIVPDPGIQTGCTEMR